MTKSEYKNLDNSICSFELIKRRSEKCWEKINLEFCWGFQIQEGSKWRKGLSELQLSDFQKQLKIKFPESLKNFYRVMNGLDKPGLNNNGCESEVEYGPTFYSYPDDIRQMKSQIEWIIEENCILKEIVTDETIPSIFPYLGHRFLILDDKENVLSMFGTDIIFWADNLSKGIASDIFSYYFKVDSKKISETSFWNKKVQHPT